MEKIIIESGKSVKKTFEGLASAGYIWQYKIDGDNIVTVDKKWETIASNEMMVVGSSANESFEIKGVEKGNATVTFYLSRSWENIKPSKIVTYQIEVI